MREHDADTARAHATLRRLQAAYGDTVTRRAWDELAELFWPEARVRLDLRNPARPPFVLDGPQAVADFIAAAIADFVLFEFTILNAVVDVDPGADVATGRLYLCEVRIDAEQQLSKAYGVYHDRYERRGDDWRIAARQYHSLARTGSVTEGFPYPGDAQPGDVPLPS